MQHPEKLNIGRLQ